MAGKDANLTVDGINLTSASNTVANLIPGVTFQLLAPSSSGEQIQVVIGNANTERREHGQPDGDRLQLTDIRD